MAAKSKSFTAKEFVEEAKKNRRADDYSVYFPSKNKKDLKANGDAKVFFINITGVVYDFVKQVAEESGLKNGFVLCSTKHTTSSVFVNHFEQGLLADILKKLDDFYPHKKYDHDNWDLQQNGVAHLKAMQMGRGAVLPIENGRIVLGEYENVIYGEFADRDEEAKEYIIAVYGE